jgi:hypothetical protein
MPHTFYSEGEALGVRQLAAAFAEGCNWKWDSTRNLSIVIGELSFVILRGSS